MYNFIRGGEQYKYATRPIVVTIPEDDSHYAEHCTDYHYISETKLKLSKRLYELFGIHLDWHTCHIRTKGQRDCCWARSEVNFWRKGEDLDQPALHTLSLHRTFGEYLKKRSKLEIHEDCGNWLHIDGDL